MLSCAEIVFPAMATPSVSFRITRSAEDLAATIHALSQRLVTLEQRLAAMEQHLTAPQAEDPEELASLENVERLLRDCRDLLEDNSPIAAALSPEDRRILEDDGSEDFGSEDFGSSPDHRDGYPAAA